MVGYFLALKICASHYCGRVEEIIVLTGYIPFAIKFTHLYIYIYTIILHQLWKKDFRGKKDFVPIQFSIHFSAGNFPFNNLEIKDNYIHIQAFQIHLVNIRTYFRYNRSHFRGKRKKARRRGRRRKRGKREEEERRVPNFHISSKSPPDDLRGERIKMKMLSGGSLLLGSWQSR